MASLATRTAGSLSCCARMSAASAGPGSLWRVAGAVAIGLPLLFLLCPTATQACADLEIKSMQVKACDSSSILRRFDVTANLKPNCMLTFRACFNVTKKVECAKVKYNLVKPKSVIRKSGSIDGCKEAEDLFQKEQERLASSGGNNRQKQGQKKPANKYAPLRCPYTKGRRCIAQTIDVSDMKKYRSHLIGSFNVDATVDHCDGGTSCATGSFTMGEVGKSGR